jgi:Fe-S-cluster-containing dehydrogenase component/DMSO reductase anchor subunit
MTKASHSDYRAGQAFQPTGAGGFSAPGPRRGDSKVATTGRLESLPYAAGGQNAKCGTEALIPDTQTLIDELLAEQRRLTAVDRFARLHSQHAFPAHSTTYRDLLPARRPRPGEQYAFAVDLDACSGCKACVAACHSLNGLDEEETWRSVGLLHAVQPGDGFQQTVTTACHHCIDPACLNGCPVLAYEKDALTGIVRHLDDQCIGCQYCIFKCPYDVPKYSQRRGIVRKCDLCASRLSVGEPTACAQACPNGAIAITVVSQAEMVAEAREGTFLPGAPNPAYTQPTTRYQTHRGLPDGLAPADAHALKPAHSHPALVTMLVLTQLSVGAYFVELLLRLCFPANLMTQLSPFHLNVALGLGLLALGTSTLHLGRPLMAWRAVLGWRTSWLSREIIVFGVFAALALLEAASWLPPLRSIHPTGLSVAVAMSGLAGVFCSLMVYHDTRRPFWGASLTGPRFFGTACLLGVAVALFVTTLQALFSPAVAVNGSYQQLTAFLNGALLAATSVKLSLELAGRWHLRRSATVSLQRSARLLEGELAEMVTARFLFGLIGGMLLPVAFLVQRPAPGLATLGVTIGIIAFTLLGELLERHLFFAAVVPDRMPGGFDT